MNAIYSVDPERGSEIREITLPLILISGSLTVLISIFLLASVLIVRRRRRAEGQTETDSRIEFVERVAIFLCPSVIVVVPVVTYLYMVFIHIPGL